MTFVDEDFDRTMEVVSVGRRWVHVLRHTSGCRARLVVDGTTAHLVPGQFLVARCAADRSGNMPACFEVRQLHHVGTADDVGRWTWHRMLDGAVERAEELGTAVFVRYPSDPDPRLLGAGLRPGDKVEATRRNGGTSRPVVGEVLETWRGYDVATIRGLRG